MTIRQFYKHIFIISFLFVGIFQGLCQKPLWVQNGVKGLNERRLSTEYSFEKLSETYSDQPVFTFEPLSLLKKYISESYDVAVDKIAIDSIMPRNGGRVTYSATFPSARAKENTVVYAQLVDEYKNLENNVDGTWDYDIYQLFAISNPDIKPAFDEFEVTRQYNQVPLAMSIIPGLGQIRKGQKAKGFAIMGSEAVIISSIIYFATQVNKYEDYGKKNPSQESSWDSKASFFRSARNIALVLGGGLYVYNLLDAALAKGAPHILIKQGNRYSADFSFHPVITPYSAGLGVSVIF